MDIDAFVLIGGRSSRMGRDKAAIALCGKTLAERAIETVRAGIGPSRITMVAASERQFAFRTSFAADVPFIFDLYRGRGAVGGLHAAVAHARTEWALVVACDYPLISTELIKMLASLMDDQHDAVIPVQPDGRLQPLCAFYRALALLENVFTSSRTPPLHDLVCKLRQRLVEFREFAALPKADDFFLNVNTPEDLERAEKICKLSAANQI